MPTETNSLLILFIIIGFFLISREIVCWYWKQNEQVKLLKDIKLILEKGLDVID